MPSSVTRRVFPATLAGLAAFATTAACTELASAPELGHLEAEVRNGAVVDPWAPGASPHTRAIVHVGGCTGTALDRRWVLTAKHCGTTTTTRVTSDQPTGSVIRAIDRIATHPTSDVVLLHLTADLPLSVPAASVYTGSESSLLDTTVACYGYGAFQTTSPPDSGVCPAGTWLQGGWCLTPSNVLRTATLETSEAEPGTFATKRNASGQLILPGDSGGPCFRGTALAGVNSWWSFDLSGGGQVSVPAVRSWIARTLHPTVKADYDGDGRTDYAVWRPSNATWYVARSATDDTTATVWGRQGDQPVLGDYDGDGKMDLATWRPSDGTWSVLRSSDAITLTQRWGKEFDVPVPGDYDGDGKTDFAVWRRASGTWFVIESSTGDSYATAWGEARDVPVPGDYDGDQRNDLAVWRPSDGTWYVLRSTGGTSATAWGGENLDIAVPGDYDGDGRTDPAIFRTLDATWWVLQSGSGTGWQRSWAGGAQVPGDYDGDGRTDPAVFDAENHLWRVAFAAGTSTIKSGWGMLGDVAAASLRF